MKSLGIIFSNIHERDIKELTHIRTLASVPYGGRYRLIDFVLSNMVNSGITNIGIITKYNYQSLLDHVQSGKNWDLSRKNGGLTLLPPYNDGANRSVYNSRLEALKNIEGFIKHNPSDYVIMSDCDIVCNFDFVPLVKQHQESGADITLVYRRKQYDEDDIGRLVLDIDEQNVVTKATKEFAGGMANVYTDFMIINQRLLIYILDHVESWGLKSFSKDVLSRCKEYKINAYELKGYYAVVTSLADYYKHSMELLDPKVLEELFYKGGQSVYTKVRDSAPAKILAGGVVKNSLISDGCIIKGRVENSVIFRGCTVKSGAVVTNSIIMQDSVIEKDSTLNCVIMDKGAKVLSGRLLSGHPSHPFYIQKENII